MKANQATWPIATMARLLGVSASGFYVWRQRAPSAHARSDADLSARIRAIYAGSRGTYGMPRVHAELVEQGIHVARKRVARLMRIAGLRGVSRRKWITTTQRQAGARAAPDLVQRHFNADAPNRLWVADATFVPTRAGFLYLAVVLDVFSRRIVGWAMGHHLRTKLMLKALDMALAQRHAKGVIHHSDQGCQYTSLALGGAAARPACAHPWAPWATALITPCASHSSPRSNANCSRARDSKPTSKPAARSSPSSKVGITRIAATAALAIARRSSTSRSTANKTNHARQVSCPPPASVMVVIGDPPAGRGQLTAPCHTEELHLLKI